MKDKNGNEVTFEDLYKDIWNETKCAYDQITEYDYRIATDLLLIEAVRELTLEVKRLNKNDRVKTYKDVLIDSILRMG